MKPQLENGLFKNIETSNISRVGWWRYSVHTILILYASRPTKWGRQSQLTSH